MMTKDLTSLDNYDKTKRKFKKRIKRKQTITETYSFFDDAYRVYRTVLSNDKYQFYTYLKVEKKSFRKSLQTTDLKTAKKLAEELFFDIRSRSSGGEKIFSLTARELVEKFLEYQQKRVKRELVSANTVRNKRTHLQHYLRFVSATQKISNIDANKFEEYLEYRRSRVKDINNTTVLNELTTIKSMYEFARENKLISRDYYIKYEQFKIDKREESRSAYTINEYEKLISFSRNIHKHAKSDEDRYYCHLIHYFILIMSNTGMRFSELHQLKLKNIKSLQSNNVQIKIDKITTKVRRERIIVANEKVDDYIKRIKKLTNFNSKESYLFSNYSKDVLCHKSMLYRAYGKVIERVASKYSDDEFDTTKTLYCLRHMFITMHLVKQVNAYDIARFCGTSLQQVQMTYDAMSTEVSSKQILNMQKSVKSLKEFEFTNF